MGFIPKGLYYQPCVVLNRSCNVYLANILHTIESPHVHSRQCVILIKNSKSHDCMEILRDTGRDKSHKIYLLLTKSLVFYVHHCKAGN